MQKDSWSYSEYSLAQECAKKYWHVVVDQKPSPLDQSGDVKFGTVMHCAIHAMLDDKDADFLDVFTTYWDAQIDVNLNYGRFKHGDLREQGITMLKDFKERYYTRLKPHTLEKRLYSRFEGIGIEGTLDFAGDFDDEPSIVDFKTAGFRYHSKKIPISLQLHLYAYLAEEDLKYAPKKLHFLIFVKGYLSIQLQSIDYSRERAIGMIANMSKLTKWITENRVYPKNYNACIKGKEICAFYDNCHN